MAENALLVTVNIQTDLDNFWDIEDYQKELYDLAVSAGVNIVGEFLVKRRI